MEDLLAPGQMLGGCRVVQCLHRGPTSAVYRAQQQNPQRLVAITLFLLPESLSTAVQQRFLQRFLQEAPPLLKLSHPALSLPYGYGEWESYPYLITPYTTAGSLATMLKQDPAPWSVATLMPLVERVTTALEYIHQQGFVHGMLTAGHLLRAENDSFQVAGLGLQRILERRGILPCTRPEEQRQTVAGTALCEAKYLAPEYVQGRSPDVRSDIYAMGVILMEALRGEPLPRTQSAQQLQQLLQQSEVARFPAALLPVLLKAIDADPARRFQRASELFAAYAEQSGGRAQAPGRPIQAAIYESPSAPPPSSPQPIVRVSAPRPEQPSSPPVNAAPLPTDWPQQPLRPLTSAPSSFEEAWMVPALAPAWSSSAASSPPLAPLYRPGRQAVKRQISRRQVTALVVGGLALGIGVFSVQSLLAMNGTKTPPQAPQAQLPANGIGTTNQPVNSAVAFIDQRAAMFRQRLLVHLPDGTFVAYKQGCTHAGVLVNYDPATHMLVCPAHGAIFDPAQGGQVVAGPTKTALPQVAIQVSATGAITLQ